MIKTDTLPNGIRIVHQKTNIPICYVGLMVGTGTRDEEPEQNGMAHYIEHCVFKGTALYSAKDIIKQIALTGGEVNAYTTKEETVFYAATPTSHLERSVRLLAQLVFHPTFPRDETDKERAVIYDEIDTYNDSPSDLIYDDFESLIYGSHPLHLPILGTRKTLRHFNADMSLRFMSQHYDTRQMVFFCLGRADFKTIVRLAQTYLDCQQQPTTTRLMPTFGNGATLTLRKRTHQAHVMLGAPAFTLHDSRQPAMQLLSYIMGGGSVNALLNLTLREQHGLVYTIEMTNTALSDNGYWSLYYATEPHNLQQCKDLTQEILQKPLAALITPRQLSLYKRQLYGQMAIAALNQENNALNMAKQILYTNQTMSWQEQTQKINAVGLDELQELAKHIFQQPQSELIYS